MFPRKAYTDVVKVLGKLKDPKKDSIAKIKCLRLIIDKFHNQININDYSNIFFQIFYDHYCEIIMQKSMKSYKEELDNILYILQFLLRSYGNLISGGWQYKCLRKIMIELCHPSNSLKIKEMGYKLFVIWYESMLSAHDSFIMDELNTFIIYLIPLQNTSLLSKFYQNSAMPILLNVKNLYGLQNVYLSYNTSTKIQPSIPKEIIPHSIYCMETGPLSLTSDQVSTHNGNQAFHLLSVILETALWEINNMVWCDGKNRTLILFRMFDSIKNIIYPHVFLKHLNNANQQPFLSHSEQLLNIYETTFEPLNLLIPTNLSPHEKINDDDNISEKSKIISGGINVRQKEDNTFVLRNEYQRCFVTWILKYCQANLDDESTLNTTNTAATSSLSVSPVNNTQSNFSDNTNASRLRSKSSYDVPQKNTSVDLMHTSSRDSVDHTKLGKNNPVIQQDYSIPIFIDKPNAKFVRNEFGGGDDVSSTTNYSMLPNSNSSFLGAGSEMTTVESVDDQISMRTETPLSTLANSNTTNESIKESTVSQNASPLTSSGTRSSESNIGCVHTTQSINFNSKNNKMFTIHDFHNFFLGTDRSRIAFVLNVLSRGLVLDDQLAHSLKEQIILLIRTWLLNPEHRPHFMQEIPKSADNTLINDDYKLNGCEPKMFVELGFQKSVRTLLCMVGQIFLSAPSHPMSLHVIDLGIGVSSKSNAYNLDNQYELCKRVLNLYRQVVMAIPLNEKSWKCIIASLLIILNILKGDSNFKHSNIDKNNSFTLLPQPLLRFGSNKLLGPFIQTLLVTFIKACLNIYIPKDMWMDLAELMISLIPYEECYTEWSKTMDTLLKIYAKHVYDLDMSNLPSDQLSEQKAKKKRGTMHQAHNQNVPHIITQDETNTTASEKVILRSKSILPATNTSFHNKNREEPNTNSISHQFNGKNYGRMMRGHSIIPSFDGNNQTISEESNQNIDHNIKRPNSLIESTLPTNSIYSTALNTNNTETGPQNLMLANTELPQNMTHLSIDNNDKNTHGNKLNGNVSLNPASNNETLGLKLSNDLLDIPPVPIMLNSQYDADIHDISETPHPNGDHQNQVPVMLGGTLTGWNPQTASILWRRMLLLFYPVLDEFSTPIICNASHVKFCTKYVSYLTDLFGRLYKIRDNQYLLVSQRLIAFSTDNSYEFQSIDVILKYLSICPPFPDLYSLVYKVCWSSYVSYQTWLKEYHSMANINATHYNSKDLNGANKNNSESLTTEKMAIELLYFHYLTVAYSLLFKRILFRKHEPYLTVSSHLLEQIYYLLNVALNFNFDTSEFESEPEFQEDNHNLKPSISNGPYPSHSILLANVLFKSIKGRIYNQYIPGSTFFGIRLIQIAQHILSMQMSSINKNDNSSFIEETNLSNTFQNQETYYGVLCYLYNILFQSCTNPLFMSLLYGENDLRSNNYLCNQTYENISQSLALNGDKYAALPYLKDPKNLAIYYNAISVCLHCLMANYQSEDSTDKLYKLYATLFNGLKNNLPIPIKLLIAINLRSHVSTFNISTSNEQLPLNSTVEYCNSSICNIFMESIQTYTRCHPNEVDKIVILYLQNLIFCMVEWAFHINRWVKNLDFDTSQNHDTLRECEILTETYESILTTMQKAVLDIRPYSHLKPVYECLVFYLKHIHLCTNILTSTQINPNHEIFNTTNTPKLDNIVTEIETLNIANEKSTVKSLQDYNKLSDCPFVQFYVWNGHSILSLMELTNLDAYKNRYSCYVRLIVRNECGKFAWDLSIPLMDNKNNDEHYIENISSETSNNINQRIKGGHQNINDSLNFGNENSVFKYDSILEKTHLLNDTSHSDISFEYNLKNLPSNEAKNNMFLHENLSFQSSNQKAKQSNAAEGGDTESTSISYSKISSNHSNAYDTDSNPVPYDHSKDILHNIIEFLQSQDDTYTNFDIKNKIKRPTLKSQSSAERINSTSLNDSKLFTDHVSNVQYKPTICPLYNNSKTISSDEKIASMSTLSNVSNQNDIKIISNPLSHQFYHCRQFLLANNAFSLLSGFDNGTPKPNKIECLTKDTKFLRQLKHFDTLPIRETYKIALMYVGHGQENKTAILANTQQGSPAFQTFLTGLGDHISLEKHLGFSGGLHTLENAQNGVSAIYYSTPLSEIIFHVSTLMNPSIENDSDLMHFKLRHIGNDEIHIVWSEHYRHYNKHTIPTEFCDILIIIFPVPEYGLYSIRIIHKKDDITIPTYGPLFDGATVTLDVLPELIRETAINALRYLKSTNEAFAFNYLTRQDALKRLINMKSQPYDFQQLISSTFY